MGGWGGGGGAVTGTGSRCSAAVDAALCSACHSPEDRQRTAAAAREGLFSLLCSSDLSVRELVDVSDWLLKEPGHFLLVCVFWGGMEGASAHQSAG